MAAALATRALTKRYGAVQALAGVDLDVEEGELVGLLGPNGAGKSTLVKICCGLVRASAGSAQVAGAAAGSPPARAALGYLAELFRFPGWATADRSPRLSLTSRACTPWRDSSRATRPHGQSQFVGVRQR